MEEPQICKFVLYLIKIINYLSCGFLFYFVALDCVLVLKICQRIDGLKE